MKTKKLAAQRARRSVIAGAPVNDPSCEPTPDHPRPVIFLHGTSDNSTRWQKAANALSDQGFCTWSFN